LKSRTARDARDLSPLKETESTTTQNLVSAPRSNLHNLAKLAKPIRNFFFPSSMPQWVFFACTQRAISVMRIFFQLYYNNVATSISI
jgi:hypothetical protein